MKYAIKHHSAKKRVKKTLVAKDGQSVSLLSNTKLHKTSICWTVKKLIQLIFHWQNWFTRSINAKIEVMCVTSPSAGLTAITPTKWQKDWAATLVFCINAAKKTQNASKMAKSFGIDSTNRFDKKSEVGFYRLPKAVQNRVANGFAVIQLW